MSLEIGLHIHSTPVGKWRLVTDPAALNHGYRTADGFALTLPGQVRLELADKQNPVPVVTRLRVELACRDGTELGVAYDDGTYVGAIPHSEVATNVIWRGSRAALALFEQRRGNNPPELNVTCAAEAYFLRLDQSGKRVRGESAMVNGQGTILLAQDAWSKLLLRIGLIGNVLVEVPLPDAAPTGWEEVWSAVDEARQSLARGGEIGWKGCVGAVRLALEKWQALEPAKQGAGWTPPKTSDLHSRTKRERLDAVRWHLYQVAHFAPHNAADVWKREDAALVLAGLTGLLSARGP